MHLLMILMAIATAYGVRWHEALPKLTWQERWQTALFRFLFPTLLLLSTAIALVCMGSQGVMMGLKSGWLSYGIGLGFCGYSVCILITSFWQGWQTVNQISALPQTKLADQTLRIWESQNIFAAQIGFWQPQLVVSSGLIQKFDHLHLEAVIKHEQAHLLYRDTFWFFCLGCCRQITSWLPYTTSIWQELLLLREIRADQWAAKSIDPLILAESLLWTVGNMGFSPNVSAALGQFSDRLEERIETLLTETREELKTPIHSWSWLGLTCLPFISIFLHS